MPLETKILFTSDLHGSEVVFKKALNASKIYNVDYLIFGGDMFSSNFILVERRNGDYYLDGRKADLDQLHQSYLTTGFMPIILDNPEDFQNRETRRKLILERLEWQAERFVKIQEEKLSGSKLKVIWNLGNDDPVELDSFMNQRQVELCQGKVLDVGDLKMICEGYVNPTPFETYREIPDSTIFIRLRGLMDKVNSAETILNVHAPPINTKLDLAYINKERKHVGSKAVRDVIEERKPLLGLHGHIHESPGIDKINETRVANPGSLYRDGIFKGVHVVLERKIEGIIRKYKTKTINLIGG
ncbi:metallophosphoesterase family protein [Metallosphaera hakonensis]|uniref:Phosphoesterase n=1 Tax=Metallosphaera hakonensis JCM 8857 = DSM 7519 TaxID=1293036 RepID=A0A2U9IQX9_9CREN|nr:metallophosphoesterase [Metallosphaera hakonensis]AWR98425.1 phosphoesterase [Metallosphaera hakonensis JCM 8857 = DSM 7519]